SGFNTLRKRCFLPLVLPRQGKYKGGSRLRNSILPARLVIGRRAQFFHPIRRGRGRRRLAGHGGLESTLDTYGSRRWTRWVGDFNLAGIYPDRGVVEARWRFGARLPRDVCDLEIGSARRGDGVGSMNLEVAYPTLNRRADDRPDPAQQQADDRVAALVRGNHVFIDHHDARFGEKDLATAQQLDGQLSSGRGFQLVIDKNRHRDRGDDHA